MTEAQIRPIKPSDNQTVQELVVSTLAEFGLSGQGFAGVDVELDDMHAAYADELSAFYVVEVAGEIQGVGGYAPLAGTEPGTIAELRKMYFRPALRGLGVGQQLIDLCIKAAQAKGFHTMYLETVPDMRAAHRLYLKNGFSYIEHKLGDTGHHKCGVYMTRELND